MRGESGNANRSADASTYEDSSESFDLRLMATEFQRNLLKFGRFGTVGIASTVLYFAVTALLGSTSFLGSPIIANIIGVLTSLLVSYVGHHRFTFSASGQHERYLPRFIVVVSTLFVMSCGVMFVGIQVLHLDHLLVTAIIAVVFPAISFVTNLVWTFADKQRDSLS